MNKHEEIKEYVSVMEHTLRRRMDNQPGKDELIKEYTGNMEKGLLAIDKVERLKKDIERFMELYNMNPDFRTETQWMEFEQLKDKLSKVGEDK